MGEPGYHGPPAKHGPQAVKLLKPKSLPQRIKTGVVTFARSFVPEHNWLKEEEITPENVAAAIAKELDSFDHSRNTLGLTKDPNMRWSESAFSIKNVMNLTGHAATFTDEEVAETKPVAHKKHRAALEALVSQGFVDKIIIDEVGAEDLDAIRYKVANEAGLRQLAERQPQKIGS